MKKVLALILILCVVQLSSAAMLNYRLSGDGEGDIYEIIFENEYTLELVLIAEPDEYISSFRTSLMIQGGGLDYVKLDSVNEKFQNALWSPGTLMDGSQSNVFVWDTGGSTLLTGPYGEDGDILATWKIKFNSYNFLIDDYAGPGLLGAPIPYSSKLNAQPIDIPSVIPEPMTMSLFALGGIALIRRRRVK